jgi:translation elongation factor EF-Tu-like GTPase
VNKIGSFKILSGFSLTGRGIVLLGDIIVGDVKVGSTIKLRLSGNEITRKITGVEMADKISTRKSWVGITFMSKEDIERKEFEGIKIEEQIIDIFE